MELPFICKVQLASHRGQEASMIEPMDSGARCEKHVGEAFPVRCEECAAIAQDDVAAREVSSYGEAAPAAWPAVASSHDEWLSE